MYFDDDVAESPYLLVLPNARHTRKGDRRWHLAVHWEGGWEGGVGQATGGGRTPWRMLLRKVELVRTDPGGRRPPSPSRLRLSRGDHVLLLPASGSTPASGGTAAVKLIPAGTERSAAVERARGVGGTVLVCRVAVLGHDDYGASATMTWDGKAGTVEFEGALDRVEEEPG